VKGRKSVPTRLKVLRGFPGHRPLNDNEPRPRVIMRTPAPPEFLGETARGEWKRRAKEFVEIGMLTGPDLGLLAAWCEAYGRFADASRQFKENGCPYFYTNDKGSQVKHPLINIINDAEHTMRSLAGEFGMSPVARPRISLPPSRQNDREFSFDPLHAVGVVPRKAK